MFAAASRSRSDGSSPLARGLRLRQNSGLMVRRIIPARAGFTGVFFFGFRFVGDHPRSRGVYSPREA